MPVLAAVSQSFNPILPSAGEIIWSVLSFAVLLVVLVKVAFPPVAAMMSKRSERIREDLEAAEQARREAAELLAQREGELAGARVEAQRIIDDARVLAEQLKSEIVGRGHQEVEAYKAQNEAQLAAERNRVVLELRTEVAGLAIELASRILSQEIEQSEVDPLVEAFLAEADAGSR